MIPFLLIEGLPSIKLIDIVDIFLVAFLFYQIYKLVKGTNAMRIFIGVITIYLIWKLVSLLQMRLLTEILGQFISVGVVLLIVVFQPEVRRFLLLLGTKGFLEPKTKRFFFWKINVQNPNGLAIDPIVQACNHLSKQSVGALIVLSKKNELEATISTGEKLDAEISYSLLETIFFKNTPLHDGAVVIENNRIVAARCILPVSSNRDIPASMGLRHRSAIGITEQTDAVSVIVSEQTGEISFAKGGIITPNITPVRLKDILEKEFEVQHKKEIAPPSKG